MSTNKNILKNGIASALQKGIRVVDQLVLIPFYIKFWGPEYYGEWLTLSVFPTILALSEVGFGLAASNTFVLEYAAGNKQAAANTAKTGVYVLTRLIIVAILVSSLIVIVIKHLGLLSSSQIPSTDAVIAIIALMCSRILNFYQELFQAYYRSARRASLSINIKTLVSTLNIAGVFIVLYLGGHAIAVSLVALGISVVMNPIYIFIANRVLPIHKEYKGEVIKSEISDLVKKGLGFFLVPIWQAVYFQGSTIVVRLILGPQAVTMFNTTRTLIRSSSQVFAMTIASAFPEFQYEIGSGNKNTAIIIFSGVLIVNSFLALLFLVFFIFLGVDVYTWWTNNSLDIQYKDWVILAISVPFYALWLTFSSIFEALNKPHFYSVSALLCAIFVVILSWYISSIYGITGAFLSNLIFDMLLFIVIVPASVKLIGIKTVDIRTNFSIFHKKILRKLSRLTTKNSLENTTKY